VNNIKVGTKLIAAFLIATTLTVIMGVYSFVEMKILDENSKTIYEKATIPLGLLVQSIDLLQEMRLQVLEWKIAKTDQERVTALRTFDDANFTLNKLIAEQKSRVIVEDGKILLDNMLRISDKYVAEVHEYVNRNTKRMGNGITEADIPKSLLNTGIEFKKAALAVINIRTSNAQRITENNSQTTEKAMKISLVILIFAGFISISLGIYLTLSITGILKSIVKTVSKIEEGDMTVRSEFKREDEFGMLSKSVDSLASKFQNIMKDLRVDSDGLASSAEELSVISTQLVNIAEENLLQSITVTSTTEQVAANIGKMAKNAERASMNSNNVAEDMLQVSANIREIANSTWAYVSGISTTISATRQMSMDMNVIVNSIKDMKMNIGRIADHVSDIRKTIDEAIHKFREVAKTMNGLGVSANEIKDVRHLGNNASYIAHRIEGIQAGASEAVAAINNVSGIIVKVNENVGAVFNQISQQILASNEIAKSVDLADISTRRVSEYVDQMARNSKDIANNVLQADTSVERVSKSVSEVADNSLNIAHIADIASKGTKLVGYNVDDMNRAAQNSVYSAKQVNKNANELARIASGLKTVVDQFIV